MSTKKLKKKFSYPKGSVDAFEYMEKRFGPLTFPQLISSNRLGEEMSQVAFAKKLGISRQHLNDIEKGRKQVSIERAAKFARILEKSPSLFIQICLEDQLRSAKLKYKVTVEAA